MKKVLIVVDMQNDFIDGTLGTPEAQAIVPNVIAKIKEYKTQQHFIFFTQDTHTINYLNTQEGQNLPVEHCIKGTLGWELNAALKVLVNNHARFEKNTFGSIALAENLKSMAKEIDEIEIVGLCTDICVLSNAIVVKAALPEVPITVDASCCAGVTPESHTNALNAMKMCQIQIKSQQ